MHSAQRLPSVNSSEVRQLGHPSIDTLVAGILAFLLAVPSGLSISITAGAVIAMMLAPVTLPALWRNKGGRWLLITLLSFIPSGWLVAQISLLQDASRSLNTGVFLYEAAIPVGLLASLTGAYWCITKLGLQRFLLLAYSGLLAVAPFSSQLPLGPWKYVLAGPVSVLVFLLLARNRLLLGLVITPVLVEVSIASNFRSWIIFLALATVLSVYTPARSTKPSASRIASLGLVTVAFTAIVSWLLVNAASSGGLGDYLQERTTRQLAASDGNLILGGRPEGAAAFALWRKSPIGIGFGVAPSPDDYWLAVRSLPVGSHAIAENNGVATYLKQGQVNFHSTFWSFWGIYGAAGVLFAVLAVVYLGHSTIIASAAIINIGLRASVVLLMTGSMWDILFSPTTVAQLATALATALYIRGDPNTAPIRNKDPVHESITAHQRHHNHAQGCGWSHSHG